MKKLISTLFTLIIYVSFCSAQSATEDSISQEDRIKAIAERIVKIPIVNEATKIDFSDIKLSLDSIPESLQLYELYMEGLACLFENNFDRFNDITINAHKLYSNVSDKLKENSMLHCMNYYCDAIICGLHNNFNAALYYMLMCDNFLAKHDPNSFFRIQTMPSIAEFNYSIGNIKNGNDWMNAAWHFIKERNFGHTFWAINFLSTYADRMATEENHEKVDSIYNEMFVILDEVKANDFIIKDFKARYLLTLIQSSRFEEAFAFATHIEEELNRYEVRDAEILLICKVLRALVAIYGYEDSEQAELYLQEIDEISRWLFRTQLPKMPNEFRVTYWENQICTFLDFLPKLSTLIDSPSYRRMIYNMQLLTKGALLSSSCSFEDLAKKSKNPKLIEMYNKYNYYRVELDKVKNVIDSNSYQERRRLSAEQLALENEMLKEIDKEGSIIDWSYYDVDSIKEHLKDRDIAIEFFIAEDKENDGENLYCAMVLGKNIPPKMIRLCSESVIKQMDSPETIYSNIWNKILEEPEISSIKIRNIYFSPIAKLCNIPIENALYLSSHKYNAYRMSSTRYIITAQKKDNKNKAALFGGMWYDMETPPAKNEENNNGCIYEYLPHTLSEVKQVEKKLKGWACNIYDGLKATEENFKALSGQSPEILLIATHGIFSNEKGDNNIGMNRTGLLMSGAENAYFKDLQKGEEDGFLFASEIEDLNLNTTDIVVLSGCRTGLGTISGEGVFGLQRGFKRAGVNTIIMSLTDVKDDVAEQFVTEFFNYYAKTHDKYKSFNKSIEKLRRDYKDYTVWSSFVMIDGNS